MNITNAFALANSARTNANDGLSTVLANTRVRATYQNLQSEIAELQSKIDTDAEKLQTLVKAAALLSSVSEENTNQILNAVIDVINKALAVLFPNDPKTVEITRSLYRETHPHYNLVLKTKSGVTRAFNQSGTGLAQIISFLFTTCLIDSRKGRNIMVMDELLSGLHPGAKGIVSNLMLALSKRKHDPFQFVCVEYSMDIGKQYEVRKGELENGLSIVEPWQGVLPYYAQQATVASMAGGVV